MKNILAILLIVFAGNSFAQGVYMEMKMSSSKQGNLGTMKVYAQDGNTRAEMAMTIAGMNNKIVSLYQKDVPTTVYLLNETDKKYSAFEFNSEEDWKDHPQEDYEVTVVGKEKVNGYNTTHVKVKRKGQTAEQELWLTKEFPDYAAFANVKTKYTGKANLGKALEAKGASGLPVRIMVSENGNTMQIDLVKAEKRNNPASLFSLDGYTKTSAPAAAIGSKEIQEMLRKMQNMTPEEREKMVEQLKKQYEKQDN